MRSLFGLVGLLIAMLVVLVLASRQTKQTIRAANAPIPALREDVAPRTMARSEALATIERLASLADQPVLPEDELLSTRETAAGWAAGSLPGSREYRCAVKVRGAADSLLAASRGEDRYRDEARRMLREAREALESHVAMPGGPVGAIRDQLENLQQSQREKVEDAQRQID